MAEKRQWDAELNKAHAQNMPLIITSLLCVQILSAARDPIVIGWDIPFWLVSLDTALILISISLVLWVNNSTLSTTSNYLITSFAFFLTGLKAIVLIVAESRALPLYMGIITLGGSLCFLSIRYLAFSLTSIFLTWLVIASPSLSNSEIASTLLVLLLGTTLSILVIHRRIISAIKVFELEQRVVTLESILPMCARCKKTRDHSGEWKDIEQYIEEQQAGTLITHGSCPGCNEELYGDYLQNRDTNTSANQPALVKQHSQPVEVEQDSQ